MTTGISGEALDGGADASSHPATTAQGAALDAGAPVPGAPQDGEATAAPDTEPGPRPWAWGPPPAELFGAPETAGPDEHDGGDARLAATGARPPHPGHGYAVPAPPPAPAHVAALSGGAWGAGAPGGPAPAPGVWWPVPPHTPPGWAPASPGAWVGPAGPVPYWGPGGPYRMPGQDNGLGIAALVCGLVSVLLSLSVLLGVILGVLAVVLGCVGRSRARRGTASNRRMATAGAVLGGVGLVLSAAVLVAITTLADNTPSAPSHPGHVSGPRTYHVALHPTRWAGAAGR